MAKQQKVKIRLPAGYKPRQITEIGKEIIAFIQDRAIDKGEGFKDGKRYPFPDYNPEYADMKGVGTGDVDLIFSGDMFNSMRVLDKTSRSVTIGFKAGTKENAKAEGNQLGTYGKKTPNPDKARPFLGIHKDDLNKLLKQYDADTEALEDE